MSSAVWVSRALLASTVTFLMAGSAFAKGGPKISIADDPSHKEGTPSLVLIEVGDFQCPYCSRAQPTLRNVSITS